MGTLWLVLSFVVSVGWALLMWATSVTPDQAVSNLSEWAKKLGVQDPPAWLRDKTADQRVRKFALVAMIASVFVFGVLADRFWISSVSPQIAKWSVRNGDPASSQVYIRRMEAGYAKNSDNRFGINIVYDAVAGNKLSNVCYMGEAFALPPHDATPGSISKKLDQFARRLPYEQNLSDCPKLPTDFGPGYVFTTIFPPQESVTPAIIKEVIDGKRGLYVLFVLAYRETPQSRATVQTACSYFVRDLVTPHECPGNTDRAFVYLEGS